MSSHKKKEHLESIKEAIHTTTDLDENQKSESMKRVEEWYAEDQAFEALEGDLMNISQFFEGIFSELGIK